MSRPDGIVTTQLRDKDRLPGLHTSNWGGPLPLQAPAPVPRDSDDVSPRTRGEMRLNDEQMVEKRRKVEEAKTRANSTPDMPSRIPEPAQPGEERSAAASSSTQSTLNSVSPELLVELRKMIRDEFQQLHKGNGTSDKISRPAGVRDRPTSPIQSFHNVPGVSGPSTSFTEDFEERRAVPLAGGSSPARRDIPTTGGSSPAKNQLRDIPTAGGSSPARRDMPTAGGSSPAKSQLRDIPTAGGSSPARRDMPTAGGSSPAKSQLRDIPTAGGSSPARRDNPTAGGSSPTKSQQRDPPTRQNSVRFENSENRPAATTAGESSPTKSQQRVPPVRQNSVRFSNETRPAAPPPPRVEETRKSSNSNDVEMTTIDKKWGVLFDQDGHTKRMEHVVRGLANYIIEEFLPQRSIVITPEKMAAFYSHHRLDKEKFPLATLFKSKSKDFHEALASLYEDLGCQYFLVQADNRSRPTVPSLTPQGFMRWIVTMVQAYPDEEAKRLDNIVSALPIEADSLLDGKAERLPKQISRYLFPKEAVRKTKRLVDDAMNDFEEDLQGSSKSKTRGSSTNSNNNNNHTGKPVPIVATATSDKRSSMHASGSLNSRYVPDFAAKEARADESGHARDRRTSTATNSSRDGREDDRSRRNSMPAPPLPIKLGRPGSVRETYGSSTNGYPGRAPTPSQSSSTRRNRSPQRNPYSQSVPNGLDRGDLTGDRFRSANISAAAANVAANVLGTSAGTQSSSSSQNTSSSTTNSSDQYHSKPRVSLDESAPPLARSATPAYGFRDKVDLESSGTSRQSKRRSMVLPEPTWDDYLKSSASRSATPAVGKKDSGYGSSHF